MKDEGDSVRTQKNEYVLGKRISSGMEGSIFEIASGPYREGLNYSNYLVKIIDTSRISPEEQEIARVRFKRLKELRSDKSMSGIMALPIEVLVDDLGYIMKNAKDYESLNNYLQPGNDVLDWLKNRYTLKKRINVIINMFESLRDIHLKGLLFNDLSPNNIMVHREKNGIVFIDTDNLRDKSEAHLTILGTPGYIAPELVRTDIPDSIGGVKVPDDALSKKRRITPESDIFSAAVIAFELLTLKHPFVGDEVDNGSAELEAKAKRIETDYIFKAGTTNTASTCLTPIFNELTTPKVRSLFQKTFVQGLDPHLRPTCIAFLNAFRECFHQIVTCPDCKFTRLYSPSIMECPGCGRTFLRPMKLSIYYGMDKMTKRDAVNAIQPDDKYELEIREVDGSSFIEPESSVLISTTILQHGDSKTLFGWNFDMEDDERPFATVSLSETADKISFTPLYDSFPESKLIKIPDLNRTYRKLDSGKEYMNMGQDIIIMFEEKELGKGRVVTYGKLSEC